MKMVPVYEVGDIIVSPGGGAREVTDVKGQPGKQVLEMLAPEGHLVYLPSAAVRPFTIGPQEDLYHVSITCDYIGLHKDVTAAEDRAREEVSTLPWQVVSRRYTTEEEDRPHGWYGHRIIYHDEDQAFSLSLDTALKLTRERET